MHAAIGRNSGLIVSFRRRHSRSVRLGLRKGSFKSSREIPRTSAGQRRGPPRPGPGRTETTLPGAEVHHARHPHGLQRQNRPDHVADEDRGTPGPGLPRPLGPSSGGLPSRPAMCRRPGPARRLSQPDDQAAAAADSGRRVPLPPSGRIFVERASWRVVDIAPVLPVEHLVRREEYRDHPLFRQLPGQLQRPVHVAMRV